MDKAPRILDAYGRPVKRGELAREIAAPSLTGIRQIWAPSVASGLTPETLAGILSGAAEGEGHDYLVLAEEMEERDPHYASVLGVRKRAISGIQPVVHAASDDARDQEIAEAVRARIAGHPAFSDLVEDLMDGVGKGFAVVEIDWARSASEWWPAAWHRRDPRHFRPDRETGTELRLLDEADPALGVPLAPFKFIAHQPRLKSGQALRGGLGRLLAFTWLAKQYTVKDWIAYVELYGLPLRLGRYGPEASKDDISALVRAVSNIGTDAAAVLPRAMQIDFEGGDGGTGNTVFEDLARWADEQISKAVLGQTMTSDNGSSMAQAEVHNEVRHDVARADGRQIAGSLNRDLVKPYCDLNFGTLEAYPELEIPVDEPEDITAIVANAKTIYDMGVRLSEDELRTRAGFSPVEEGDDVIGGARPGAQTTAARALNSAGLAPLLRALNRSADPYGEIDRIEAAAALEWEEQLGPALDPIEALLAESASLDEFRTRLPELAGEMDLGPMIDALVGALFRARAEGELGD